MAPDAVSKSAPTNRRCPISASTAAVGSTERGIGRPAHAADRVVRIVDITPCSGAEQEPKVGQVPARMVIGRRCKFGELLEQHVRAMQVACRRGQPSFERKRPATPSRAIGCGGEHDHLGDTLGIAREVRQVGVGRNRGLERAKDQVGPCDEAGDRERLLGVSARHVQRTAVRLRQRQRGEDLAAHRGGRGGHGIERLEQKGRQGMLGIESGVKAEPSRLERGSGRSRIVTSLTRL